MRSADSTQPGTVRLGIGEEFVPAREAAEIDEIVSIHRYIQEESDRKTEPVPRGQHPKQHGCVRAEFIIEPDLPEGLKHGVFREPRTYAALIRFSNGRALDDRKRDAHGMAIKLLGVEGAKVLEGEMDATTQDFVMIDHPVFFVKNVADYVPLMKDFRRISTGSILGKGASGLKVLFSPNYKFRLLRATASKRPASPLGIQYWSTTPSKLGAGAMKFSARPAEGRAVADPSDLAGPVDAKDGLRKAMSDHLKQTEAVFDFLVQVQADPVSMPIEDATILWAEATSPFVKVATVRIPVQSFESDEQMEFGENLSFTPWHALAEHRPLGGINRARKRVYEETSRRRRELNGAAMQEPRE